MISVRGIPWADFVGLLTLSDISMRIIAISLFPLVRKRGFEHIHCIPLPSWKQSLGRLHVNWKVLVVANVGKEEVRRMQCAPAHFK